MLTSQQPVRATRRRPFAPAAVFVLVAAACSSGMPASATTPALTETARAWVTVDQSVPAFEDAVLTLINQRRAAGATCGSTPFPAAVPLRMSPSLRTAARSHSEDMAVNDYFSHTSLDGRTSSERIRHAGYAGSPPFGENIAAGPRSPQAVVDRWMASSGHCGNIMSRGFLTAGVGYAYRAGSPFGHYWTMTFGGS